MPIDFKLLKKTVETPGAPGFESAIRRQIIKTVKPYVDELETDNLGNIYALKKGIKNPDRKKVAIAAHMDEISFIVSHIDDKGFIKFHPLGGFDPKTLTAMRVLVNGKKPLIGVMGCKPIHIMTAEERKRTLKVTDYFIDLGLPKKKVEKLVVVGDPITRYQDLIRVGDFINGKSLDNRLSCYILIEALKCLKKVPYDVYGVFTVQEEVGIRGASVAGHRLNPDFGIALDVTIANDVPGSVPHEKITELGKGAAIKVLDGRSICDYRMVDFLKQTANKNKISWQTELLPFGGTDTEGIQRMGKQGAIAGAISIPLRYMHQTTETAHPNDISAAINLLTVSVETIDTYNWVHS